LNVRSGPVLGTPKLDEEKDQYSAQQHVENALMSYQKNAHVFLGLCSL